MLNKADRYFDLSLELHVPTIFIIQKAEMRFSSTYQMNETKWNSIICFFDRLWEDPEKSPDSGVLLVMNTQESRRILTQDRLRLLSFFLKKAKSMLLAEIADKMQSSQVIILRGLKILEKLALVEKNEKGYWQPWQMIILPELELRIKKIPKATAIL